MVNRAPAPVIKEGVQYVGNPSASVVLTYYFDYECPHCYVSSPKLDELEQQYGDRIVVHYKNFQMSRHAGARLAAIAAEAARRQGKFIAMHRRLMAHARTASDQALASLQTGAPPPEATFTPAILRELAAGLGLDLARYDRDSADPTAAARIDAEYAEGEKRGVTFVPVMFVGDQIQDTSAIEALPPVIDARLAP